MGELLIELRKANMQAMKDHDTVKKGVLSLVISSIALAEKEDGKTLTKKKIEILESYLPRQLTEEEIKTAIESILTEKGLEPVKKSQGVVMKEIMAKYKGQTDGKTVNKVLSTILK